MYWQLYSYVGTGNSTQVVRYIQVGWQLVRYVGSQLGMLVARQVGSQVGMQVTARAHIFQSKVQFPPGLLVGNRVTDKVTACRLYNLSNDPYCCHSLADLASNPAPLTSRRQPGRKTMTTSMWEKTTMRQSHGVKYCDLSFYSIEGKQINHSLTIQRSSIWNAEILKILNMVLMEF